MHTQTKDRRGHGKQGLSVNLTCGSCLGVIAASATLLNDTMGAKGGKLSFLYLVLRVRPAENK